jgi:triosephosphate isomerase
VLFINLKTYESGTGDKALVFAKEAERLFHEIGTPIVILAQAADVRLLASSCTLPIWAQHMDNIEYGKNTGWTLPQAIMKAGAKGTMINHAEHKLPLSDVSEIVNNYKTAQFDVMVSTTSPEETLIIDQLKPSFITYEPQEYIGTKTSVVDVAGDVIQDLVRKISCPMVIGAGIHKPEHIMDGIALGAKGFLISSDILLSQYPIERLREYMLAEKNANSTYS